MQLIGIHENTIDPEIHQIALRIRKWTLRRNGGRSSGYCYFASAKIIQILNTKPKFKSKFTISSGRCAGGSHTWLEYNEKFILDVTADQFNWCIKVSHDEGGYGNWIINDNIQFRAIVWQPKEKVKHLYRFIC